MSRTQPSLPPSSGRSLLRGIKPLSPLMSCRSSPMYQCSWRRRSHVIDWKMTPACRIAHAWTELVQILEFCLPVLLWPMFQTSVWNSNRITGISQLCNGRCGGEGSSELQHPTTVLEEIRRWYLYCRTQGQGSRPASTHKWNWGEHQLHSGSWEWRTHSIPGCSDLTTTRWIYQHKCLQALTSIWTLTHTTCCLTRDRLSSLSKAEPSCTAPQVTLQQIKWDISQALQLNGYPRKLLQGRLALSRSGSSNSTEEPKWKSTAWFPMYEEYLNHLHHSRSGYASDQPQPSSTSCHTQKIWRPVDWSNIKVLSNPRDTTTRVVEEAAAIRTENTLERDIGTLSTEYDNLFFLNHH